MKLLELNMCRITIDVLHQEKRDVKAKKRIAIESQMCYS